MAASAISSVTIHQLSIPLRRKVSHATSERAAADPVIVTVELISGATGYGETEARAYVTGETQALAAEAIERAFVPRLLNLAPDHFPGALEAIDALPFADDRGRPIVAARAAVELALLDAYARHFDRPLPEVAGWMGLAGFGQPGSAHGIRYSGVLASDSLASTLRTLRLLWWYGLRDFKLKVGLPDDDARVAAVYGKLRRAIDRGSASLRVDANGAWTKDEAIDHLNDLWSLPLAGVEQPLAKGHEADLPLIHDLSSAPLFHDESLVTLGDAHRLVDLGVADGFNIRISKCGGLLPSLRLADFARRNGVAVQLGCMVGETSILSAAGRWFLELVPQVRFAEGWFGSFLLASDVVRCPLRFGYGGRGRALRGPGLGVEVLAHRLAELAAADPLVCRF